MEIDHIIEWATVRRHEFANLIALCPTCHARKGSGPGQIDRKSLFRYKSNLAILNQRYNDTERRVIDYIAANPDKNLLCLPGGFEILIHYLIADGHVADMNVPTSTFNLQLEDGRPVNHRDGTPASFDLQRIYIVTDKGLEFVRQWVENEDLTS